MFSKICSRRSFSSKYTTQGRLDLLEKEWLDLTRQQTHMHKSGVKVKIYGHLPFSPISLRQLSLLIEEHGMNPDTLFVTQHTPAKIEEYRNVWSQFYRECKNMNQLQTYTLDKQDYLTQHGVPPTTYYPMVSWNQPIYGDL